MDRLLTEIMKESGQKAGNTLFVQIKYPHFPANSIVIKQGFFFLLVTNGTTAITDAFHRYTLSANQLLVLTPSTESMLSDASSDFSMSALYINPDYFDSLPDGQPVYNQVARYLGNYQLPIFVFKMPLLNTCKNDVTLFRAVENHAAVSGRHHPPSVQFSSPANHGCPLPGKPEYSGLRKTFQRDFPQFQETAGTPLPGRTHHPVLCRPAPHLNHLSFPYCQRPDRAYCLLSCVGTPMCRCPETTGMY